VVWAERAEPLMWLTCGVLGVTPAITL
jgi:hypothetical protein